jgi:DNA-binding LacI/PurR family transcriptional regulator
VLFRSLYHELIASGVPLVLIDRYFPDLPSDRVTYDDDAVGAAICGRLFDRGAKRLAVLSHREFEVTSVQGRLRGAFRAALERGLPADAVAVWPEIYRDFSPSRPNPDLRAAHLERLRKRLDETPVDALFAVNGDVAERVSRDLEMLAATGADLQPIRLGACGHQSFEGPNGDTVELALEPAEDLGRAAAEILVRRLAGQASARLETRALRMTFAR